MLLNDLLGGGLPAAARETLGAVEITNVTVDSRKVEPGGFFIAVPGSAQDGAKFVPQAVENGAVAVLADRDAEIQKLPVHVPVLRTGNVRKALADIASRFHPRQPKTIAAVTGTAGKTSVASFLRQIWGHIDGAVPAMIGTTGVFAPGRSDYGSLTTPDPVTLHELLDELAGHGVSHCAMEASSHGLDQMRLDGVRLSVAGFTNLGRDHLDYHSDIEEYLTAKLRLFGDLLKPGQPAVIYADDEFSARVIDHAEVHGLDVKTVGREGEFIAVKRIEQHRTSQVAEVVCDGETFRIELPLAGEFQLANALVAAGMAIASGMDAKTALAALASLEGASGRLELIGKTADGAACYVDYAHKPEALENVLAALRPYTTGELVLVFGCGGDRDPGKRAIMGDIADRLADRVIVTDDNPRSENPGSIRAAIVEAAPGATEIGDRHEAIICAVESLKSGDTLIVAGKGHEEGQIVGETVLPFSDHAVLREALGMVETAVDEVPPEDDAPIEAADEEVGAADALVEVLQAQPEPEQVEEEAAPSEDKAVESEAEQETSEPVSAEPEPEAEPAPEPEPETAPEPQPDPGPLWTLEAMGEATRGWLPDSEPDVAITGLSIDTRSLQPGDAYFAIKGDVHDGHKFVAAAHAAGAAVSVVAKDWVGRLEGDCGRLLVVDDVLHALVRLGLAARARTSAQIVAITGSVGKTTTKEMLRKGLAACGDVHAAVASFNNHWGVPLTLARMPAESDFAVIEIGMNHPGEITPLVQMTQPHVVVINNVAAVHLGAFNSVDEIAHAKSEIFDGLVPGGTAVLNADDERLHIMQERAQQAEVANTVLFGEAPHADVRLDKLNLMDTGSTLSATVMGEPVMLKVGAPGRHIAQNALVVLAVARLFDADLANVSLALAEMEAVKGRGQQHDLTVGQSGAVLIDESYNANPTSMTASLNLLGSREPAPGGRRIAVLGDMLELGETSAQLHADIAEPVIENRVSRVFLAGREMRALRDRLTNTKGVHVTWGETSDDIAKLLGDELRAGDVVMAKASLGMAFAKVIGHLLERYGDKPDA